MIDEITQNISPVTPLPGLLVENRPAAVNQLVEEELPLLSTQLETLVGQLNTTISQTNIAVDIAANAAVISNSLSNYVGEWNNLVTYDKNQTTSIGTLYYISKVDNNLNHIVTDTNYWLPNPVNTKIDYNMSGYTEKVTPVDTDLLPLSDSAATFGIKKLTWADIKATIKTYFDTLYLALTGDQTVGGVKTFTSSPIVPAPTTAFQVSTKGYVDSKADYSALIDKTTPVDADLIAIADSTSSFDLKKLTWANLKINLQSPTLTTNATLTATDNKIVMNGIVTALDLEIGDVIKFKSVASANNQKMRTVENIINNNEIIVNYEHCGNRKNGSLKLTSETLINATITRIAKWYNAPVGLGQAWVDMAYANTTLTSSLGRPSQICITSTSTTFQITSNGTSIPMQVGSSTASSIQLIVDNGESFSTSYANSILYWRR